jgi:hypothetical protein
MPEYLLKDDHVTYHDLNSLIDIFKKIRAGEVPAELIICAEKRMLEVDTVFIGYLMLFKEEIDKLDITVKFPYNLCKEGDRRFEYKVIQYGTYAYLLTSKSLFTLFLGNDKFTFNLEGSNYFPENSFVLSDSFMLLLLVSGKRKELYNFLFENSISSLSNFVLPNGLQSVKWNKIDTDLYKEYNRVLIQNGNPQDRKACILSLAQAAFYKSAMQAKILSLFLAPQENLTDILSGERVFTGNLSSRKLKDGTTVYDNMEYYAAVKYIFFELMQKPLIYQLVFSTLTASDLLPSALTLDNREQFINKLWALWHFTKDVVHGIKELAKNILEHSSTHIGIIASQIIHKEYITDKDKNCCFKPLLQAFADSVYNDSTEISNYLNIQVYDLGSEGIIPTLINSSRELEKNVFDKSGLQKLVQEDINMLEQDQVNLADLLHTDKAAQLNQQCKRSIAHYGLLTFSKLIIINRGLLVVGTQRRQGERQVAVLPQIEADKHIHIEHGTIFNVMLPVNTSIRYDTHIPHPLLLPAESSVNEIKGIEELLSFKHIRSSDAASLDENNKKILISYKVPAIDIADRKIETDIWRNIKQQVNNIPKELFKGEKLLFNLDFSAININASQLLRLMGSWETEYPRICLIVSNIELSIFLELLEINDSITKNISSLGFWNETMGMLIYSYVKMPLSNNSAGTAAERHFYFMDVFWGSSLADFLRLNKSLHRNHFNSTSLLKEFKPEAAGDTSNALQKGFFSTCPAFFNSNMLLPFDLVLTGLNGSTLFENNAAFLLQNQIKE